MKNTSLLLLSAGALALFTACNDPAEGQPKATAAAPVTEVKAQAGAAAKYAFSAADSKVEWTGAKVTATHDGKFSDFKGSIDLVDNDPTKSKVSVDITTASLAVEPAKLAGHLKSADFFDVEKFPTASFSSTSIAQGATGGTHTVTGNLTLHGVTKSISFPASIKLEGERVYVLASFAINRKDFNLVYPGMPDDLIKDDVLIKLSIEAKKG